MFSIFNSEQGTQLRSLIRLLTVGFTAFGLKLHVDQIALIQAALEAVLALFVASPLGSTKPLTIPAKPDSYLISSANPTPAAQAQILAPVAYSPPPVNNGIGFDAPESGTSA